MFTQNKDSSNGSAALNSGIRSLRKNLCLFCEDSLYPSAKVLTFKSFLSLVLGIRLDNFRSC